MSQHRSPRGKGPYQPSVVAIGLSIGLSLCLIVAGCSKSPDNTSRPTTPAPTGTVGTAPGTTAVPFTGALSDPEIVATGLSVPWGLAFLPDGSLLIPERPTGRILIERPGKDPELAMQIQGVERSAEGGLLGLAVSPNYADDKLVFAYYTTENDNRIVRFTLGGTEQVIVEGIKKAPIHDGGRLAFGPDGMLYATTGDAGDKPSAQDLDSLNGKILRLNLDGTAPGDNPFAGSRVYSYGHRNVQGITWDAQGRLWSAEFGQNQFDEVNLITRGANYGWPDVEGTGDTENGRFVNPVITWTTSEASPSGIAYFRGSLYVAALRGQKIWRIPVDDQGATGTPEALLDGQLGRLRTVVAGPDGALWISTSNTDGRGQPRDGDDKVLRFTVE